jgi:hypothetical protein
MRVSHHRARHGKHRVDKKVAGRTIQAFGTGLEQRIGHAVKVGGEASMLRQCSRLRDASHCHAVRRAMISTDVFEMTESLAKKRKAA